MNPGRSVAFFCTPETGHFRRIRALVRHVAAAGREVVVFTDRRFRSEVETDGGIFHDLYGRYPLEEADGESHPVSCRHVSYAGKFADEVACDLRNVDPAIVIYDSFALVGLVAARMLELPHVCVCSGHDPNPGRLLESLRHDPRVNVSPRCDEAVRRLRERYGIENASPFSFVETLSPHLNLYCEPPEYLDPAARRAFEPLVFFGSLATLDGSGESRSLFGDDAGDRRKIYISFGTVIWRYYVEEAVGALHAIAEALGRRPDVRAIVSLGRGIAEVPGLAAPNLRVVDYLDQWRVLQETDLFVTHHGLNSTHEAAFWGVPMLSYPFFWDQPGLAARCAELGLAVPLAHEPRAAISAADVDSALAETDRRRDEMHERLEAARTWERQVVAGRDAVVRRILELATR